MKKLLIRFSLVLLILVILCFSAAVLILNSEAGSRWLITQAIEKTPGELQIGKMQGRLLHTLVISDLNYHAPGTAINAKKIKLNWNIWPLYKGKISVSHLHVDGLSITLENKKTTSKPAFSKLKLPLKIHLNDVDIKDLHVQSPALSSPIHFDHLQLNAKIYPELLSIQLITHLSNPTQMDLRLETFGKFSDYHATLVLDQENNHWSLQAEGQYEHLTFHTKQNQILGGSLSLTGSLNFGQRLEWLTNVDVRGVNPELILPNWPGNINFKLHSQVDEKNIDLSLNDLSGSLKDNPISGEFHYQKTEDQTHNLHSDLRLGQAKIKADGKMNKQLALVWNIDFPQLQDLLGDYSLSGSLRSEGSLSGTATRPIIHANLKSEDLHYQAWSVENLQMLAQYQEAQKSSHAELKINNVHHAGHALGNLSAKTVGTEEDHTLSLNYQNNESALQLKAQGNWINSLWEGRLNEITFKAPLVNTWHLESPTQLRINQESLQINPLCLMNQKASLCFNASWKKSEKFNAHLKAHQLPLDIFNPWLSDMRLRGDLNTEANLSAIPKKTPTLDLKMQLTPGVFYYTLNDITKPFNYEGGQISAQLNDQHFNAKATLKLLQNSTLTANVAADPNHWDPDDWSANPLRGDFSLQVPQLEFLAGLIPKISKTQGSATGRGSIGGNLRHPQIDGTATVSNASFTVPDVNAQIKQLNATGSLHKGVFNYQGKASAGEGTFNIQGSTQVINKQLHTHLALQGKNILISDTPGVKVVATPKLEMNIVDKVMSLTGKIFIPKGEFRSYDYNDTLELPDEITYRQATPLKPVETAPVQLTSFIDLSLGDNIRINSNGLSGKLTGSFAIRDVPGGATTAEGRIALTDGLYDFRGQKLTVERGILNFNGGPVNNPNLNVRAVRRIGSFGAYKPVALGDQNRVVGIYISGTLDKHTLTLFSEPDDITQTDILSYLVLGQSMSGVSSSSGNAQALLGAAQALNLSGAGGPITRLKSQLEQKLGLSEFDITSYETKSSKVLNKSTPESTIQHTAFVLGRYLSPKLYVNYSFDILDHTNIFRVRYFFNKKWSIQSESSSVGNALDILYSFERG